MICKIFIALDGGETIWGYGVGRASAICHWASDESDVLALPRVHEVFIHRRKLNRILRKLIAYDFKLFYLRQLWMNGTHVVPFHEVFLRTHNYP